MDSKEIFHHFEWNHWKKKKSNNNNDDNDNDKKNKKKEKTKKIKDFQHHTCMMVRYRLDGKVTGKK